MLGKPQRTSLEFTRTKGQYFKIGKKALVTYVDYHKNNGSFEFQIKFNKENENYHKNIGEKIKIGDEYSLEIIGYSVKTKRVEIRVTAPSNVKIDRG